jgi:hypothetical protein
VSQAKDERLAEALAGGANVKDAAAAAGVSRSTAQRRLQDPAFCRRVQELRREMTDRTVGRVQRSGVAAATVLSNLMLDAEEDRRIRLSAAQTLLAHNMELARQAVVSDEIERLEHELEQLRERLDRQEAQAAAGRNGRAHPAGRGGTAG